MGNCQAIDAAALVIQHPDGRLERMYWPVTVSEVMRANPGHYVSLIVPLQTEADGGAEEGRRKKPKAVRVTRVELLRPTEMLTLGHAYRLVTSQELTNVLRAKKRRKMKQQEQTQQQQDEVVFREHGQGSEMGFAFTDDQGKGCQDREISDKSSKSHNQGRGHQRHGQRMQQAAAMGTGTGRRWKSWRPGLQSISEGVS